MDTETIAIILIALGVTGLMISVLMMKLEIMSLKDSISIERMNIDNVKKSAEIDKSEANKKLNALERYLDIYFKYPDQRVEAVSRNNTKE